MNYYVLPIQIENEEYDFIWCVMESKTDQLIRAFEFEDEALEYEEFLNDGGAFDGFTPSFVLREVVMQRDVNSEFRDYLAE